MTYQLVLVLLSNVVEVDIGDRIVTSICKMKVKVFRTIKVDPVLSIRVVIWQSIRLQHLCFQLLLLEQQLFHHLLTYIDSIGGLLLL